MLPAAASWAALLPDGPKGLSSCPGLWPLCAVTPRGPRSLQPPDAGGFLLLLISRLSLTLLRAPSAMSLMPAPFHFEVSDFSVPGEPSEW